VGQRKPGTLTVLNFEYTSLGLNCDDERTGSQFKRFSVEGCPTAVLEYCASRSPTATLSIERLSETIVTIILVCTESPSRRKVSIPFVLHSLADPAKCSLPALR
jgi:hypothetical protein